MATCDDRQERALGLKVVARRAAGGRGGMSRIGKLRIGLSLSYRCALPRRAATTAAPHAVHGHGVHLGGIVWPGHLREQRVEGSRGGADRLPPTADSRRLDLAEALLAQAHLAERVAAEKVLAQSPGRPNAELRTARGFDAVAHGDDGVEAVESQRPGGRSIMHFLHIAFGRQLVVGQRPLDVTGYHRLVTAEQLGHLLLREPDRFVLEADVEADLAVGGLVEDDLATVGLRSLVRAVTQRSERSRSAQG